MTGSGQYHAILFWVFGALAVLPGLGILLSKDIVRQAFWLLSSLVGFACLYLHIGADFLGFTQVVVYIGGILILFLFGVMLTQRADVPLKQVRGWGLVLPGLVVALVTMAALLHIVVKTPQWKGGGAGATAPVYSAAEIGKRFLGEYLLPFGVISVVLLVAMVGATYVARRREADRGPEDGGGKK